MTPPCRDPGRQARPRVLAAVVLFLAGATPMLWWAVLGILSRGWWAAGAAACLYGGARWLVGLRRKVERADHDAILRAESSLRDLEDATSRDGAGNRTRP